MPTKKECCMQNYGLVTGMVDTGSLLYKYTRTVVFRSLLPDGFQALIFFP